MNNNDNTPATPSPGEIRLRHVNPKLIAELNNIASHLGVTLGQMLKPVLREFVETKPAHWRSSKIDDSG